MAVRIAAATWVGRLSDADIARVVGPSTLGRARSYVATGAVRTLVEGDGGRVLLATVAGSRATAYQCVIKRTEDRVEGRTGAPPTWSGICSCPVVVDCKHTAAVLVTAREALAAARGTTQEQPVSPWEQVLAPLVRTVPTQRDLPALALEVSLGPQVPTSRGRLLRRVRVRPLREGKSGRWVKQGAGWPDLATSWGRPQVRPDQREVLSQVYTLYRASAPGHYGYGNPEVHLDELGTAVWPVLRRCIVAGVPLVAAGPELREVRLAPESAQVTVDVTRDDDGALAVQPVLQLGHPDAPGEHDPSPEPDLPAKALLLQGDPAHGVAVLGADGVLTLAPLTAPPPDALVALLTEGGSIAVPPADARRFLALYHPVLARQLPVGSSDGSVELPTAVAPLLTLGVTHTEGHRTELGWGFAYRLPGDDAQEPEEVRVGLAAAPADPPRDREHEHRLLESLTELDPLPQLQHRSASGSQHPRAHAELHGLQTVTFMSQVLPALEDRQDVLVDVQGDPPAYGEADEAPVVHLSTTEAAGGDGDWFDLHVTVSVDEQQVPFEALFAALARGDEALLLDSGTWFTLDRPELVALRALIEEARELTDVSGDTVRVSRYQVGWWEELVSLGVVDEQSQRWGTAVDALLGLGDHEPAAVPEGLRATLRPYQLEGFRWLSTLRDAGLGGVLADDMGLGKTMQALAMVLRAVEQAGGEPTAPVLVVAPASVVGTWVEEAARFAPGLQVAAVTATAARRGAELSEAVAGAHLVVTSYTLLRLEAEQYRELSWSGLVLDEAQFVKNHRSRTYQAVRRLGAPFTVAITGTPLENSLMDLWSMLSLAAPGLFPRPEVFVDRYRKPIESGHSAEQLAVLRRRVRPFMLRRTKEAVAPELPAKQEQTLHIDLAPAHRKIYGQHLQRERQRVLGLLADMDRNRVAIFRALTLLRQLSLDPSLVDAEYAGRAASAKIEVLLEHVQELAAEGHRALVFSSFTGFLALVRERLEQAGIGYSYLDGRTRDRPARIAAFRQGQDPVFLISLKAGGFGLTLTEADYVFVLDPWWNPAAEAQAVDRTHRIGQTKPVNVYRMVSADTIEDKVVALQQRKRDLFAQVVDGGEFTSGAITADDIRGLLDG